MSRILVVNYEPCNHSAAFTFTAETILPEPPKLYAEWRRLVAKHSVSGKKVHDTRLVASIAVHGLERLLTFDVDDFARYDEIQVFQPKEILTGTTGESVEGD